MMLGLSASARTMSGREKKRQVRMSRMVCSEAVAVKARIW